MARKKTNFASPNFVDHAKLKMVVVWNEAGKFQRNGQTVYPYWGYPGESDYGLDKLVKLYKDKAHLIEYAEIQQAPWDMNKNGTTNQSLCLTNNFDKRPKWLKKFGML